MKGPTVLPAPPLAVPVAEELVIVPVGKLDPGMVPGAKLVKLALAPAKPPTTLLGPPVAEPADEELLMEPKFTATNPPMMSWLPRPVTEAVGVVEDCVIVPRFTPTKPPRKLSELPVTLTAPEDVDEVIVPSVTPTNPPVTLFGPVLVTDPEAVDCVIEPGPSAPMNPPSTLS